MNANRLLALSIFLLLPTLALAGQATMTLDARFCSFSLNPENGSYRIVDKRTGVDWNSSTRGRFGEVVAWVDGKRQVLDLGPCQARREGESIIATFRPVAGKQDAVTVRIAASPSPDDAALSLSYEPAGLSIESVRILDSALAVTAADRGYYVIPVREGLLIPADTNLAFTHAFDTYAYEGCHMAMLGLVKKGSAMLIKWSDPYVLPEVRSTLPQAGGVDQQTLTLSLTLRNSARNCTLHLLGKGDYVSIGAAYRDIARARGWLTTWDQKLKENPNRRQLFGAINYKLWSTLSRRMNLESTKEEDVRVNWTFDEAAQIAEHLKNDLKLDKVHFLMGGWIRRGYDNQHPDILPAAPECGGDEKLADCAKRVMALGYLFGLHDNYQDIYRDSPSWNESYIMKRSNGELAKGGHWAGGLAYLTCSAKALELARRPQNLPAVRKLTGAGSYFIDTTYAAGLQECFDPAHPLTRADDMKWKQALSDYARQVFGIFGSECGREWAIPHSDYFEGLTGVSGGYYHDANLVKKVGGTVIPLFEIVYRDCIAMYGKYGYDIHSSAEYVLHHISIGRTLNYHSIPPHLYWKSSDEPAAVAAEPAVAEARPAGTRKIALKYRWNVDVAPAEDWNVLVHFTNSSGKILFQGDYRSPVPTSQWKAGTLEHGPFTITVPAEINEPVDIRMGLFQPNGPRAALVRGIRDRERRVIAGRLKVNGDQVEFIPPDGSLSVPKGVDPALYVRGDGGWSQGLHPLDRFVKNTYEILSPLNEITSQMRLSQHEFLTPDRKVRRSVFGEGPAAVTVVVNGSAENYTMRSQYGGQVILPPGGFAIDSQAFAAFCALSWGGESYDTPTCFTLRSTDGASLLDSAQVRVFHAFGSPRVRLGASQFTVGKEMVLPKRQ